MKLTLLRKTEKSVIYTTKEGGVIEFAVNPINGIKPDYQSIMEDVSQINLTATNYFNNEQIIKGKEEKKNNFYKFCTFILLIGILIKVLLDLFPI